MISEVHNMDCMEFMRGTPDKFYDLAICDPPYFKDVGKLGYFGEKISGTGIKRGDYDIPNWNNNIPTDLYLTELIRISKHQIIWGINYYKFFHCVGRIIWDKVNDDSSFSKAEIASCSLHDSVQLFRFMWNGMLQGDMKNKETRIHPTQKPVKLYKWLLHNYAKQGDKIFDSHMGSQSSRIAAYDMGFDYWGTELDKDYFESGNKRFEQFKSQGKLELA